MDKVRIYFVFRIWLHPPIQGRDILSEVFDTVLSEVLSRYLQIRYSFSPLFQFITHIHKSLQRYIKYSAEKALLNKDRAFNDAYFLPRLSKRVLHMVA
jgi:hypothetical protein